MEIQINDLMEIQNELDSRIFELHQTTRPDTRNDRVLALLVEAGELANETRCFKYWSVRKPSADEVIFEEFSDVVHFALSLGIDIDFDSETISFDVSKDKLNDQFHQLYHAIGVFKDSSDELDYIQLLAVIFSLAHSLGLDGEGVRTMYLLKNKKNHKRQDENY